MKFEELYREHAFDKSELRFQKKLADFIIEKDLQLVVETGSGLSSLHILKAMEQRGSGTLISIDPEPFCEYEIEHPMYQLIKKKSVDAMTDVYNWTGPWDLLLSDADHDILCQTYEYEMAYACLKTGGWLVADDWDWAGHGAWRKFIKRQKLKEVRLADVMMVQKEFHSPVPKDAVKWFSKLTLDFAIGEEAQWLAAGNKNTFYDIYPPTRAR